MAMIPATLLLEERAALAMNAVVGLADDDQDGIPFFSANLLARPARLEHGDWDYGSSHGRLTDAILLARQMTGSKDWEPGWDAVADRYRQTLLALLGADGLTYRREHPRGHWKANANLIDQRATLLALTTTVVATGDPVARAAADRQVAALKRIAIKERDVWFYPASEYTAAGWPSSNAVDLHLAPDPASFSGRLIMPLLRYHQATGNPDALELCEWFARLVVDKSGVFLPDGSFNAARVFRSGHFHTRVGTLEGLARLARHTGDHGLTQFVRRSYDWVLTQATGFGWTPGDLADQRYEHETCSLVDLIGLGATLAGSGLTEYWPVVERFVRNHLAASQLLDVSWVESASDRSGDVPGWRTQVDVGERVLGAFCGYGAPNDYVSDVPLGRGHTNDVQACCVGSGVRGLFWAWNSVVTGDRSVARVNLLLSRAHRFVDVLSHLPVEGKVELLVNEPVEELRVRVPDWAGYARLTLRRDGGAHDGADDGERTGAERIWAPDGYLSIPRPRPGERIVVTFPMAARTTTELAAGNEFRTGWRGDDVVAIDPPGRSRPMYGDRPEHAGGLRDYEIHRPETEWSW
ncbi:hypothetical protein EV644_109178 [Kribbella orskensis]|uniref:Beta-L-arabinofuranosidase (Glycosyl hydrolase family 127) n=1 Tax=Kribbella orskensis TaxID=2512216 RepID=A0ABY2BI05_9ACTN|nr:MULTISPECIES: hypothetical protein [Kribbella]TCN38313.1 hypothetical protein EV642_10998 [Kribbella sp. VKM Ac-2500]TCO20157.1 hypothetical protein EV644_109178 [Kribbella orskensis]